MARHARKSRSDTTGTTRGSVPGSTPSGTPQPPPVRAAAKDIERLEALLRATQAENARLARLAAIPEQNPNPIVEIDSEGRIRYANPSALREFPGLVEKGDAHPWLSGWKDVVRSIADGGPARSRVLALAGRSCHQVFVQVSGESAVRVYGFDVTDQVTAEQEAARTRETFVELVERAPFGIYIVDAEFRIAVMNAGSRNRAFRNVRSVVGRDFGEAMRILWPEHVAAEIVAIFRRTLDTGEPYYSPRFVNPRNDVGIVESYEWELHRIALPVGQHGVICYYFDSTALREAEQALRRSEAELSFVLELNDALRQLDDPIQMQEMAARLLGERLQADRVFYSDVVAQDGIETCIIERDYHRPGVSSLRGRFAFKDFSHTDHEDYRAGRTVRSANVFADERAPSQRDAYRAADVAAFIGVPFVERSELVGVLGVLERQPREWTPEEVRLAEQTADRTWHAVQRARAEQALRENELEQRRQREFLECLVAHAGACISVVKGRDLRYTLANPAFVAAAGGVPVVGRTYREVFPEMARAGAEAAIRRVLETGEPWKVASYRAPVPGIPDATWDGHVVRLPDQSGEEPSALVVVWDITERKRAEESLEKTANIFAEGQRIAHVGTFEYLSDTRTTVWSEEEYRIYGLDPAGPSPAYDVMLAENIHPDDAALLHDTFTAAIECGSVYELEHRIVRPDGSVRWVYDRAHPYVDQQGSLVRYLGVTQDVTARKQAEEALRRSQAETRTLLENSPAGLVLFEAKHPYRVLAHNRYYQELFAEPFRSRGMAGLNVFEYAPAVEAEGVVAVFDEVVRTRQPRSFLDFPYRSDPPKQTWFNWHISPLILDGEVVALVSMSLDVTERHVAEEALRESERRERERAAELQTILDTAPLGVAIAGDASGHHIRGNRANEEMFGLPPGAELSKSGPAAASFRAFRDGRELASGELPMQRAIRGEVVREQVFDVVREDGQALAVYAKATPLFDEAGRPRGAVGAFLDITDLKRAERALREANAALAQADRRKDEFIAILSHELRNPLAPIRYALPLLSEERLGDGGRRAVAVIDRQITHLMRLVDDLLDVSRITSGKIELRTEHVTLAAVLSAAVEAASPAIAAAQHSLDVTIPDGPIWLNADAARISQAVTNLLNNSAKYTPRGGRIRLEATPGETHVAIRVADNGVGIAADALVAVFEMFHQGEGVHKSQGGLGIGLGLARQLVEMHRGSIEAHSAGENQGAEFVIRLPLASPASRAPEQQAPAPGGKRACLRVLVVDDNVDLVDMLAMVVEADGHDVRKAFDGRSAISAALEYQPHLILLDVGLPDMSGMDVARELRRHADVSGARMVALTGWGQAEDRRRTAEAGFDDHLTKPADPRQIQQILEEVAQRVTA
jgi:PAS domain S-box-containing protein